MARSNGLYDAQLQAEAEDYLRNYEQHGDDMPSIVGLARFLGITRQCCHNWARDEDKPEWKSLMARLKDEQERVLLNKGLNGKFNPTITKLVLAKHGYQDKAQVEHSGPDGGPIHTITSDMTPEEASRIYMEKIRGNRD